MLKFFCFFVFLSGLTFINEQKNYWQKSSQITKQVLTDIQLLYWPDKAKNQLYFVNLPDSVNGPPWPAYLFRRGLNYALKNLYNQEVEVFYLRTIPTDGKVREDKLVNLDQLNDLKKEEESIFIYNPNLETVEKF